MSEWNVDVNGRPCRVTADRAPNGKLFIRANGRIVAPPQPEPAVDCWFSVDNANFHLWGVDDALQLVPVVLQPAEDDEPAVEPAAETAVMPDPDGEHHWHVRIVTFIVFGVVLFLITAALTLVMTLFDLRIYAIEMSAAAGLEVSDTALANGHRILMSVRIGYLLEAFVGIASIVGGALLIRRTQWAPRYLEFVAWSIPGAYLLSLIVTDVLSHRQLKLAFNTGGALRWLSSFHLGALFWLTFASIVAGVLLRFLQREKLEAFLAQGRTL